MRKGAVACLIFILTLALSVYLGTKAGIAVTVALAIAGIILFLIKRPCGLLCTFAAFALFASLLSVFPNAQIEKASQTVGEHYVSGRVTEIRENEGREYRVSLKADTVDGERVGRYFYIDLELESESELQVGTRLSGKAVLSRLYDGDGFPTKSYSLGKGIALRGELHTVDLSDTPFSLENLFYKMRQAVKNVFYTYMSEDSAALASGIVLGDDGDISYSTENALRACGIAHVLSVSGLHVSILIFAFSWLLGALGLSRSKKIPAVIAFAVFYMLLTGMSPSICRSVIMAVFANLSFYTRRFNDPSSALMVTAAIMCLIDPLLVANLSFQLSVTATLGIVLASTWVTRDLEDAVEGSKGKKPALSVASVVVLTLFATAFCLPIGSVYFGELSLLSPLGNVIGAPIAELILIFSMILALLSPIRLLAVPLGMLCDLLCTALVTVSEAMAKLDLFLHTGSPTLALTTGAIILFSAFCAFSGVEKKTLILCLGVAASYLLATVSSLIM